jgi:hypothetical protein
VTSHSVWECQWQAKYLSKEMLTQRAKGNMTCRAHVWHRTLSLGTLGCLSAPGDIWVDNKHLSQFRQAIWEKLQDGIENERRNDGTNSNWEVWIPLEMFRIFGWLDDTDMKTHRPRPGRTVKDGGDITDVRDTQVAFYK